LDNSEKTVSEQLEEANERLNARREEYRKLCQAQELADLKVYDPILEKENITKFSRLILPHITEGLPITLVIKPATPDMLRRYRTRVAKAKRNKYDQIDPAESIAAVEELASKCVVFPDKDVLARIFDEYPTAKADTGVLAIKLAQPNEVEEGKD